jgi:hypothetical protein
MAKLLRNQALVEGIQEMWGFVGGRPTDRPMTDQPARKRTALAEKMIPRYHTIFFLAAGFKLALLVKL